MKKTKKVLAFLLLFMMLPVSAGATPVDADEKDASASVDVQPAEGTGNVTISFHIPDRHSDKVEDTLLNDPQYDWPWKYIEDEVHLYYGYYTSMGCDDVLCTNPEHTHWCPRDICRDQSHGHSGEEYALAASREPTCACHRPTPVYIQPEERSGKLTMSFHFPDRHSDKVEDTLLNNPQYDWPWKYIEDEVHLYYGYYTSMGCDDVLCTNPEHTHWCPRDICRDQSHGHSEEEYALAASREPTCACHKR